MKKSTKPYWRWNPRRRRRSKRGPKLDVKATLVTGTYLFDAERVDGKIRAVHMRERIRTLGPTVRLDLGKQAEGTAGAFAFKEA